MNEYTEQAEKFLADTGSKLEVIFKDHDKHFESDIEKRDIYQVKLSRGRRSYTFDFGQSIQNSMKYQDKYTKHIYFCDGQRVDYKTKASEKYLNRFCKPIIERIAPSAYDILACLQKYPVDTFEDFCSDFGFDEDSRQAYKIYKAVKNEYESLSRLYSDDELELMAEIQ